MQTIPVSENMKRYDEYEMPQCVKHKVEVYIRMGGYTATITHETGGNCKGKEILDGAMCSVEEWEFKAKDVKHGIAGKEDGDGYLTSLTLIHEEYPEKSITLDFDDDEHRRALGNHIVGVAIVDWEEENR